MPVLKLTLGKIIFLQNFLQFLFFKVKHSDGLLLRPDGQVTSPDASGLVVCLCGIARLDEFVMRLNGVPTGLHIAFQP
jgi:hypothetical protein